MKCKNLLKSSVTDLKKSLRSGTKISHEDRAERKLIDGRRKRRKWRGASQGETQGCHWQVLRTQGSSLLQAAACRSIPMRQGGKTAAHAKQGPSDSDPQPVAAGAQTDAVQLSYGKGSFVWS